MTKPLKEKIEKILRSRLYDGKSECPYCDWKQRYGKAMGLARHIQMAHPDKYSSKADRPEQLFQSELRESLKEIFSKLPSKADPMSRDEILERIEEVRAELKRLEE